MLSKIKSNPKMNKIDPVTRLRDLKTGAVMKGLSFLAPIILRTSMVKKVIKINVM